MKKIFLTSLMTLGMLVSAFAITPEMLANLNKINSIVHFDAAQWAKAQTIANNFSARRDELKAKITNADQLKQAVQVEAKAYREKMLSIMTDAQKKLFFASFKK